MEDDSVKSDAGIQSSGTEMRRTTLQDLANATNLSRSTVSRALRNHPAIAESTIRLVHQAAARLNYHPDAKISDLMFHLRRSKGTVERPVIAMVIQQDKPHVLNFGVEKEESVFAGAMEQAKKQGYQIEPFFAEPGEDIENSLSRIIWARGIHGVIIAPLSRPKYQLKLKWDRFCLVAIGHSLQSPTLHKAVHHQYQGFVDTIDVLVRKGYRRIGVSIAGYIDIRTNYIYRGAYYAMRSKHGGDKFVELHDFNPENRESFLQWYEENKPDIIVGAGAHDHYVLPWLESAGVRCPRDVSYASVHLSKFDGSVAGMKQNSAQVGAAAVDLLINTLRHNERGIPSIAHTVLINGTWVDGKTAPGRQS